MRCVWKAARGQAPEKSRGQAWGEREGPQKELETGLPCPLVLPGGAPLSGLKLPSRKLGG